MLAVTAMLAVPALMLASCGNDDGGDEASGGDNGKIGLVFDIGGKGDKSFNDAASKGLNEAADELGYETKELEPDEGGQNRAELLESLASGGYNPVIGVGFLFADSVLETAQAHPDTTFAIVDNAYGPEDEAKTKNIKQLVFAEEQGSFLVGAAAAMKTKSDTIGFIGGVETDLIKKFERYRELVGHVQIAGVPARAEPDPVLGGDPPVSQRELILDRQRDVVSAVMRALRRAYPQRLNPQNQTAITMMLFGMINWTFTWLRPDGPMSYAAFADEVIGMLERGLAA